MKIKIKLSFSLLLLGLLVGLFILNGCGQVASPNSVEQTREKNKQVASDEELEVASKAKNKKNINYYVAPNSQSTAICTLADPCKLEKALAKVKAKNTIFMLAGVYYPESIISISASGVKNGFITIRNYKNHKVILNGQNILSASGGLITIKDQSYIKIQGLEITNYKSASSTIMGIYVSGTAHHIQLLDNHIHEISSSSALGIAVYGTNAQKPIHNILVAKNTLENLQLGDSESLTVAGNVTDFSIRNNIIHDVDNVGIDVAGFYGHACWDDNNPSNNDSTCNSSLDYARNGVVSNNIVYDVDTRSNNAYPNPAINAAAGIYVDGARDITIEKNKVYSAGVGISISSENSTGLADNTVVRNNFIYNNWRTGINLGPVSANLGKVNNCKIINNTLFNNDNSSGWGGELYLEYNVHNCLIANNIFYASNSATFEDETGTVVLKINLLINDYLVPDNVLPSAKYKANNNKKSNNNYLLNNLYFASENGSPSDNRTWFWQGKWYNQDTFDTPNGFLIATEGTLNQSIDADPNFVNLSFSNSQVNLHLSSSSPAINRGKNLASKFIGKFDIDGEKRHRQKIDIGADEWYFNK